MGWGEGQGATATVHRLPYAGYDTPDVARRKVPTVTLRARRRPSEYGVRSRDQVSFALT
jgi:hypothetical protein